MAKEKKQADKNEAPHGITHEIIGIVLLAISIYSGLSLYSYAAGSNLAGVVGQYVSWAAISAIGYTSYIFPILLSFISIVLLLRRVLLFRVTTPVSFFLFIIAASTLLSEIISPNPKGESAGGLVGGFVAPLFSSWFGYTGSIVILIAVLIITIIVGTRISLIGVGKSVTPRVFDFIKNFFGPKPPDVIEDDEDISAAAHSEEDNADFDVDEIEEPKIQEKPKPTAPLIHNKATSKPKSSAEDKESEKQRLAFANPKGTFKLPPLSLLDEPHEKTDAIDNATLLSNSKLLEKTLLDFGIEGRVLEVMPGPVVTMYEFEPAAGVKVNKITNLSDDLALAMKAMSIRIIAPIPGKSVVGIEIPNPNRDIIGFKEMLESPAFAKSKSRLTLALGKDISGAPYAADLARMPHLLVAGATGTGKSVSINSMILSILFKATPEDVRFLMVDPKMLELSAYENIPHLLSPVITDPKRAAGALRSIVSEMGKRYKNMAEKGAKNIEKYNQILEAEDNDDPESPHKRLPYIVVIIDELADLMMTSGKDVEECLVRLSQMARASGIHLMIATQRPSVDVVTGLIKTNFPARIAFQLPSRTDSRTILDASGAETLLGQGDMLYLPPGSSKLMRLHGVYVSENEIRKVTEFWKAQGAPAYDRVLLEEPEEQNGGDPDDLGEEFMKRYREAVELAETLEMISTSYIQRRFRVGYNTAARIIEKMEREGVVGPAQGSKPREVLRRG